MPASWEKIETELKSMPTPEPRNEDAFWADFRARAQEIEQDSPAPPRSIVWPTVMALAAAALLVFGVSQWTSTPPAEPAMTADTEVKSLEVAAAHSAVFILNDTDTEGTVVWISDLEIEGQSDEI